MNLLLHGIEDFNILRGDTLVDPKFHREDALERFHCVIANPPFSLKNWGRETWEHDPYKRNRRGLPSKSKGDLVWVAHMLTSMHPTRGRVAVVLPLGALLRSGAEAKVRQAMIEEDLLDAAIELGPNLFSGTGVPAAMVVFRRQKPEELTNKVLFVNASQIYTKGRAQDLLTEDQSDEIHDLYRNRIEEPGRVDRCRGVATGYGAASPHSAVPPSASATSTTRRSEIGPVAFSSAVRSGSDGFHMRPSIRARYPERTFQHVLIDRRNRRSGGRPGGQGGARRAGPHRRAIRVSACRPRSFPRR